MGGSKKQAKKGKKTFRENLWSFLHTYAPSGYEERMVSKLHEEIEPHAHEVEVDGIGNLIAYFEGSPSSKTIVLLAHTDEISAVVTHVDEFVWFRPVGWFDSQAMVGASVTILTKEGDVQGVGRSISAHLKDVSLSKDVWIDVGEEIGKVGIGDPVVFSANARWMGEHVIASKAIDDRIGDAVLVEVAKGLRKLGDRPRVYLVGTVQEEVGGRGAKHVLKKVSPDYAIAVDTTYAHDPSLPKDRTSPMGSVVIRKFERSEKYGTVLFSSPKLTEELSRRADSLKIPYQFDTAETFTDLSAIHSLAPEVHGCVVLMPRRYSHSPNEVSDVRSGERVAELLASLIKEHEKWM